MLDVKGSIWKMGVTKLGQRWCSRKKYLCPQRVSVINAARNRRATKKIKFIKIACGNHHNLAISSSNQLYSWGQNIWLQCGHPSNQCGYGDVVDQPRWVPFYKSKKDLDDEEEKDEQADYKIIDVVAGEHMTVCLATNGSVWTCGRNACGALGRKTRSEGMRDYGSQRVKTEVKPDFMRKVKDLEHVNIDWIGCGSVVWFAHNRQFGAVYSFGDASSGRAGIGCWKSARGRPVFDEYNLDTHKYEVTSANGGSDHVIFTVKRKKRLSRRHSTLSTCSDTNSRATSLALDEAVVNGMSNLCQIEENENENEEGDGNHNGNHNKYGNAKMMVPATQHISRKRKRKRNQIAPIIEEQTVDDASSPDAKRRKGNNAKPVLESSKTTPVVRSKSQSLSKK